jgi:hypothetical protein
MKILADFHHTALYYSLYLLFEKRLGHKLYRPIGLDWYTSGFWKISDLCANDYQLDEKLKELLIKDVIPPSGTTSWNETLHNFSDHSVFAGYGGCPVSTRGVTLEQFKEGDFGCLIATFINNVSPFKELSAKYQNSAPVVFQVGNEWPLDNFKDDYILASIKPRESASNILFYKQEFNLDTFSPVVNIPDNQIASFVCWVDVSEEDRILIEEMERRTFGKYKTLLYGKFARSGYVETADEIARIMKASKFGLHLKLVGDGYGHIVHNWFAVGRPVIFRGNHYKDRLAGKLLEHGITGIDLDIVGLDGLIDILLNVSDDEYLSLCSNVRDRFKTFVDFDNEAKNVGQFLEGIL